MQTGTSRIERKVRHLFTLAVNSGRKQLLACSMSCMIASMNVKNMFRVLVNFPHTSFIDVGLTGTLSLR
jgi:hypothetical protein